MPEYLGIDTSNYTTSAAIYNSDTKIIIQQKLLLPVKEGELGLRQSDAVFHHTNQLPIIIEKLFNNRHDIKAIAVSTKPRGSDGSYMPCFLSGESLAKSLCAINSLPLYKTSHQTGHILAALYSCGKLEFINRPFIAFHVSGGTTDCLYVQPDEQEIIKVSQISSSLDLKAGQAVDRVGVMLGLRFPCGKELEALALKSNIEFKIKPSMKGMDCSLSGVENKCKKMLHEGKSSEDIARFCIKYIEATVDAMTALAIDKFSNLPVLYAGGVMSNSIIRDSLTKKYAAYFAQPEFSCDNAAGVAIHAAERDKS